MSLEDAFSSFFWAVFAPNGADRRASNRSVPNSMCATVVDGLVCPSDGDAKVPNASGQVKANYGLCRGDSCWHNNWSDGTQRGMFGVKQWNSTASEFVVHGDRRSNER